MLVPALPSGSTSLGSPLDSCTGWTPADSAAYIPSYFLRLVILRESFDPLHLEYLKESLNHSIVLGDPIFPAEIDLRPWGKALNPY